MASREKHFASKPELGPGTVTPTLTPPTLPVRQKAEKERIAWKLRGQLAWSAQHNRKQDRLLKVEGEDRHPEVVLWPYRSHSTHNPVSRPQQQQQTGHFKGSDALTVVTTGTRSLHRSTPKATIHSDTRTTRVNRPAALSSARPEKSTLSMRSTSKKRPL